MLFYGPPGAGKKTRVLALLQEVFGKGVTKIKTEHRSFKINSKTIEITTLGSNYHIEMNPSDAGIYDRVVVQKIIKEIASSQSLMSAANTLSEMSTASNSNSNANANNGNNGKASKKPCFKVVVLNEVDKLTKDAQHGLRRTMEKYMSTCRIILQCNCVSKVIGPLRSRCLAIRVAAPSHDGIVEILKQVSAKERITIDDAFARQIAVRSRRNLRRALLMLQVSATECNKLVLGASTESKDARIKTAPWQLFVEELARLVVEEQSPQRLLLARQKLYELLSNCIPPDTVFERLTVALMENVDDSLRKDIAKWAAYHEHRMQTGSKPVIHLEAFLARFMHLYKQWQVEFFG